MKPDQIALISAAAGLTGIVLGAILQALIGHFREGLQKQVRRDEICNLVIAEIANLRRHSESNMRNAWRANRTVDFKKMKYRESGFMSFDVKDLYFLNHSICIDILNLVFLARNNDLEIEWIIEELKGDGGEENRIILSGQERMYGRMEMTIQLCSLLLQRMEKYLSNPKSYREKIIDLAYKQTSMSAERMTDDNVIAVTRVPGRERQR